LIFNNFVYDNNQKRNFSLQNAKAIIQPSYFEGWSTVIEDAKALNKYLIVSILKLIKNKLRKM